MHEHKAYKLKNTSKMGTGDELTSKWCFTFHFSFFTFHFSLLFTFKGGSGNGKREDLWD